MNTLRERSVALFKELQNEICSALEGLEASGSKFIEDRWTRTDLTGGHGGGGQTRILKGSTFEKAGVNFSEVQGILPGEMTEKLLGTRKDAPFYATGTSLVVHPFSPLVPTTHANFRYLEVEGRSWFGGGADLTPYRLYDEDCRHFHAALKSACDKHDPDCYSKYKKWCDEYFYLPHRKEGRGIGGVFLDYIGKDDGRDLESCFSLISDLAKSISQAYMPIVAKRKDLPFTPRQKEFQLVRRGRYVEFNLIYDRGTHFGLKTSGRTESILMSLPAEVRWEYNFQTESPEEAELISVLQHPKDWL